MNEIRIRKKPIVDDMHFESDHGKVQQIQYIYFPIDAGKTW